jgi:hypothetical protein
MQDTLEAGFWMLVAGYWILDAGYWILDAQNREDFTISEYLVSSIQ